MSQNDSVWFTPNLVMTLADGSTLIKPGKPILRANARQTSRLTGISFLRQSISTPVRHRPHSASISESSR